MLCVVGVCVVSVRSVCVREVCGVCVCGCVKLKILFVGINFHNFSKNIRLALDPPQ